MLSKIEGVEQLNKKEFFEQAKEIQDTLLTSGYENDLYNKRVNRTLYSMDRVIVSRSKTINELINSKNYESVGVLIRSLLELYLSLNYILKKKSDVERKVDSYFYNSKIEEFEKIINLADQFPEESSEHSTEEISNLREQKNQYIQKYNKLFVSGVKNKNKKWYNLDNNGVTSIPKLMTSLDIDYSLYVLIYQLGSMDVHGTGVYSSVHGIVDEQYSALTSVVPIKAAEQLSQIIVLFSLVEIADYYELIKGELKQKIAHMKIYINQLGIN